MHLTRKHLISFLAIFFVISFFWAVLWTALALQSIKVGNFATAQTESQLAQPVVSAANIVTLHQVADLQIWQTSLSTIQQADRLQQSLQAYFKLALQNNPTQQMQSGELKTSLKNVDSSLITIASLSPKSVLFKNLVAPKLPLSQLASTIPLFESSIDQLLTGQHRYILLFQNSDELRATGGFMGSYAVVDLNNGNLAPIQFYDIFDADGQITSQLPAPPGVKEYLSGGQGQRLPNANWNPDFPTSAQDTLQLFALSGIKDVDGLIAINLSLVQQLLQVTGPIVIPNTNQTVTADNLPDMARADRENYFPGSKQKKNFLQALSTQLRITLPTLNSTQQFQLAKTVAQDIQQKNIQLFFHQAPLQQLAQLIGGTGQVTMHSAKTPFYLMLVESNVGINKANKLIARSVQLDLNDKTLTTKILFTNHNPVTPTPVTATPSSGVIRENPRNDYINYQRVLLPTGTTVSNIIQDQKPITAWDTTELVTSSGEHFLQIGFLAPVAETQPSQLSMTFALPTSFQLNPTLILQKQAGLPPTQYSVRYNQQQQNFLLDQDKVIQFQP